MTTFQVENATLKSLSLGTKPTKAPCMNCKERKVGEGYNCHSECKAYKRYKNETN